LAELEGYGFWGGRITEGGRITDMEEILFSTTEFFSVYFFFYNSAKIKKTKENENNSRTFFFCVLHKT
jgi:hypothetical protein